MFIPARRPDCLAKIMLTGWPLATILFSLMLAPQAWANICRDDLFRDGLQVHSSSGVVSFGLNAAIRGNPDAVINAARVSIDRDSTELSCGSNHCTASGTNAFVQVLEGFRTTHSSIDRTVASNTEGTIGDLGQREYRTVNVESESALSIAESGHSSTDHYLVDTLNVGHKAQVNLRPGNYWIRKAHIESEASLNVIGVGTVRLYIHDPLLPGWSARFNVDGLSQPQSPNNLVVVAYGDSSFDTNLFSGFLYSIGRVTLGTSSRFFGGVVGSNVKVNDHAELTFFAPTTQADLGQLCPVAPAMDADGDGIQDGADLCSSTDKAEPANADGCSLSQLDSDKDLINDATDLCPNTPAGVSVNGSGCAVTGETNCRQQLFADGLQAHDPAGQVRFGLNAQILGNADSVLGAASVGNNPGSKLLSCKDEHCKAGGLGVRPHQLQPFRFTADTMTLVVPAGTPGLLGGDGRKEYGAVTVKNSATLSIDTVHHKETEPYLIDRLVLGYQSQLNVLPGTYWIKALSIASEVKINVVGTGTAKIYLYESSSLAHNASLNHAESGLNLPDRLLLVAYNGIGFNNSKVAAYVVVNGNASLGHRYQQIGALAGANISTNSEAVVQFKAPDEFTDLGQICPADRIDSDHDRVPDMRDLCLGTDLGDATVDQKGCAANQRDSDSDGVLDSEDKFPHDSTEHSDLDGDGIGDNGDFDRDGDMFPNDFDAFPNDSSEQADLDGDEIGDNSDTDRDGDGYANEQDLFPSDPSDWLDLDEDGTGDNADGDRDGDGVANEKDDFPDDKTKWSMGSVRISSPGSLTTLGSSPITVTGTVAPENAVLSVNGVVIPHSGGQFIAQVALREGHNTVVAKVVIDEAQFTDSIYVSLDKTPPYITVDSHLDGDTVFTNTVTVTGLVNDIVRGTIEAEQATVSVNGVPAVIANRSYAAENIPLTEGVNTIIVRAVDQTGNASSHSFTLTHKVPSDQLVELISGQSQQATIGDVLAQPLTVRVVKNGEPLPGATVVYRVVQGSGTVGIDTPKEGRATLVETDAQGVATTRFRIGDRAGAANHKVKASVVGYENHVVFNASGIGRKGDKISVNSGNNQRGVVGQVLPEPFVVVVTDSGANVVKGARVRFDVKVGDGNFGGEASLEVVTDSDGRATGELILGPLAGLDAQRVTATLLDSADGSQNTFAGFTATGFVAGDPGQTTISGVILDNQDVPIPGIAVRVDGTTRQAISDSQGQFRIEQAPVGPVHLVADGSTATVPGEYPSLAYNLVTIAGVDNPLAAPIYMVKLNTEDAVFVGPSTATIELTGFPGFKLEVAENSVTFPDGAREGYISVTSVNSTKVPMAPPNGMQPQFIVTIQPTGTLFDPPARLSLPNVDGHPPGAQVEMYSYDHDLEEFVAIGLGTVNENGTVIASNVGVGVVKAGWHCGSQPGGSGAAHNCPLCKMCDGSSCVTDPSQAESPLTHQVPGDCTLFTCGGKEPLTSDFPKNEQKGDCLKPNCNGMSVVMTPDDDEVPDVVGTFNNTNCYFCRGGESTLLNERILEQNQNPNDCRQRYCDGTEEDKLEEMISPYQTPGDCKAVMCEGMKMGIQQYKSSDIGLDEPEDCKTPMCFPDIENIGTNKFVLARDQSPPEKITGFCTREKYSCGGDFYSPVIIPDIEKINGDPLQAVADPCLHCKDGELVGKDGTVIREGVLTVSVPGDIATYLDKLAKQVGLNLKGELVQEVAVSIKTCCTPENPNGTRMEGRFSPSAKISGTDIPLVIAGALQPLRLPKIETPSGSLAPMIVPLFGIYGDVNLAVGGSVKLAESTCGPGCWEAAVGASGTAGVHIKGGAKYCVIGSFVTNGEECIEASVQGGAKTEMASVGCKKDCEGSSVCTGCFGGVIFYAKATVPELTLQSGIKLGAFVEPLVYGPYLRFGQCL